MTDIEKARQLFRDAGLAFPTIPEELAEQLKEHGRWLFSTRPLDVLPYDLQHYLHEVEVSQVKDYAVLSHGGHGVNSYAIQYYLVHGSLCIFLHLGWGGVYMDRGEAAATIRDCFSMADQIASLAQTVGRFQAGKRLTVVGSDFYGSYWLPPGKTRRGEASGHKGPLNVLTQTLDWLTRRQTEMHRKVSKIDPKLGLGLHELANSGKGRCRPDSLFSFQLEFAKTQAEDIWDNRGKLIENTIKKAPVRPKEKDFKLCRRSDPARKLTREEDKWERAIHEKWGPEGSGEFVSVCKRIQTYQYPLRALLKDSGWGEIDLLGIGKDCLPVPVELKKRKTNESPLRMLVEVAAYGFAIRKVWPKLKDHWVEAVRWFAGSPSQFPTILDRVTLVGVAPDDYWSRCLGRVAGTEEGKFPSEAWPPFWKLVDYLGEWFDIHFVTVEGGWDDTARQPTVTRARVLDLRSLRLNSTADPSDSEGTCLCEP